MKFGLPFLSRVKRPADRVVRIVDLGSAPGPVYALGDIHGCTGLLHKALMTVAEDAAALGGNATVILLGDVVDRGPDSAGVIELLCDLGERSQVLSLLGNHERMMLSFAGDPVTSWDWLSLGGYETLQSYGLSLPPSARQAARRIRQTVTAHIPEQHLEWLRALPHGYRIDIGGVSHLFVHAGLEAARPINSQTEAAVLWGRNGAGPYPGHCVVQGHVVVPSVRVSPGHVMADTGAWSTGRLSAVRFTACEAPFVLTIQNPSDGRIFR